MTTPIRVLVACPRSGNPYVSELVRSLNERPGLTCIQSHSEFLGTETLEYDVVHFQWPEALFGWNTVFTEADLQWLDQRLSRCNDQGIRLIGTVHNEAPHVTASQLSIKLYEILYRHLDAFVHLGQTSIDLMNAYRHVPANATHVVIPHGNYSVFRAFQHSGTAGYKKSGRFTMLCFGAVRKPDEVRVICRVADALAAIGGDVVVAGRVNSGSRRKLRFYKMQLPLFVRRNVRVLPGKVPDEHVASMVSISDALLIPRVDTLNSGNVALGFTFGKVVVGPDIGVIGEELKRCGNPVFNPADRGSLQSAVTNAKRLSETSLGDDNQRYAETDLAWGKVASMHEVLYRSLQTSDR